MVSGGMPTTALLLRSLPWNFLFFLLYQKKKRNKEKEILWIVIQRRERS